MINFKQLETKFVLRFAILLHSLILYSEADEKIEEIEKAILDYYKCK